MARARISCSLRAAISVVIRFEYYIRLTQDGSEQVRSEPGARKLICFAESVLNHLGPRTIVLADKAYDGDRIRELIQQHGATPNIPPKSNRRWKPCFSRQLYRERNLIERFFSKLKHFRRVATRYDKLAANFLAMVQLASIRLWLRAYESTA